MELQQTRTCKGCRELFCPDCLTRDLKNPERDRLCEDCADGVMETYGARKDPR